MILKVAAAAFRQFAREEPEFLEGLFWTQVDRVRSLTREVTRTHEKAITDALTRLYNHGFFRQRLEIELERARATGDQVSLVLFDIDHFKKYNDTYGHEEGNEVLLGVAQIMKGVGRRGDIIARYGGEEFVALLYGASCDEAQHVRGDGPPRGGEARLRGRAGPGAAPDHAQRRLRDLPAAGRQR